MNQAQRRTSPVFFTALAATVFCALGVQSARGAAADASGPVSRRVAAAAMPNHAGELLACFDEARAGNPAIEVRLKVAYVIRKDGTVSDVAVPEADRYDPVLESCVKSVVGAFTFYPSAAPVLVNAPLVFRSDAAG